MRYLIAAALLLAFASPALAGSDADLVNTLRTSAPNTLETAKKVARVRACQPESKDPSDEQVVKALKGDQLFTYIDGLRGTPNSDKLVETALTAARIVACPGEGR